MSTLLGSIKNPSRFVSPLDRVQVMKEGSDEEKKVLHERLSHWQAFFQTRNGVIVRELADPAIAFLVGEICKSVTDFPDWSADKIRDYKNTLIGELRVWRDVEHNMDLLERRLDEIKKLEDEEKARDVGGLMEEDEVPEPLRKHLRK